MVSMRKSRAAVAMMVVVLLVGCSSMPPPEVGNKTLLVLQLEAGRSATGGYPLEYELGLAETEDGLPIAAKNGIALYDHLPPGTYTIDRIYAFPGAAMGGSRYLGDSRPVALKPFKFTLKEGSITILPFAFAVSVEAACSGSYTQVHSFVPADRMEVIDRLAKHKTFSAWRVED